MNRDQSPVGLIRQTVYEKNAATQDPTWLKLTLITIGLVFFTLFLLLPLVTVFTEAFRKGVATYMIALTDPDTMSALRLTLLTAFIALPINIIFGICAAWAIAKHNFKGKQFLLTLIDLPFSISPVIVGLLFVLFLGSNSWFGHFFLEYDIKIIFAVPGIILVTLFVTFPFIARELIPLMETQGKDEEEASAILGANGLQTFFYITLPKIKWGLLYGVILSNARAMGEFGAVSVVSGHIRGQTNTLPLQVEILYNEYNFAAAFAVASLLALLALFTLVIKLYIDKQSHSEVL